VERELFAQRLQEAAVVARNFARTLVEEPLPDSMLFRLRLNSSYDGNPLHADEVTFPNDSSFEQASRLSACSESDVVEVLWRNGRVPEWVDVSVIGETGSAALLQLLCCGRFTSDAKLLYHEREGRQPFHVTSPVLPARFGVGDTTEKFSIYDRSECWTVYELRHVAHHASKVWSLELVGPPFDDGILLALPMFTALEILELHWSPITGAALRGFAQHPRLRVLRIHHQQQSEFAVPELSPLAGIQDLTIRDPPTRSWGCQRLVDALPNLNSLSMSSATTLRLDAQLPPALAQLSLTAHRVEGGPRLPREIDFLCLHLSEMADREVAPMLSGVDEIRSLDLSGTPITSAFVNDVLRRHPLRYLNVVRTAVSEGDVRKISAANPTLKMLPNLRPL
jgi:hypothetical protein